MHGLRRLLRVRERRPPVHLVQIKKGAGMTPTPNPTAEQIEAVLMFAERGYLRELGAIDPRHHYSEAEEAEQKRRFENYREGVAALRAHGLLSEGAPSEEQVRRALDTYTGVDFYATYPGSVHYWEPRMRAALTAAGVAPQEPTLCVECGETEVLGKPEYRVLCMDCAYETGVHAGRRTPALDPEKAAEVLLGLMRAEAMTIDNGGEEWIAESDPVECLPPLARALCEAYTEGKLT